jgi:pimeloyl-ACP methyl ester carboxylesterase
MQQRHFRWYGAETGRTVVYFHGAPGAAIECGRFHAQALAQDVRLVGLERSATERTLRGDDYFERLAEEVTAAVGEAPFEAIGFSIGAMVALRTAPHFAGRLQRLHLIAAAAPLESGDFLDGMAGKALFQLARRSPKTLRRLASVEGWLALHAPSLLFSLLFSGAAGADRALAADPAFRGEIDCILRLGLGAGAMSFARDVIEYVQPWAAALGAVSVDTRLWHGDADNWTPPAMADCLERLIPTVSAKTILPGASHYSCLIEAVPRILAG